MDITFCIPYYGKEEAHKELLTTCIRQIRKFYPDSPVIVCKTSNSYMPDSLEGPTTIYDTFVDGSHIFGAIELLTRVCKTKHFLICHDSMFMLKPLPAKVLHQPLYPLWHFNEASVYFYDGLVRSLVPKSLPIKIEQREYNGVFGPAFGGTLESLKTVWELLAINDIKPYLWRTGLMGAERVLAIVFMYMGCATESLNGNINKHPDVFKVTEIPDFSKLTYDSYFFKVWKQR
jgi:hypothetical protein